MIIFGACEKQALHTTSILSSSVFCRKKTQEYFKSNMRIFIKGGKKQEDQEECYQGRNVQRSNEEDKRVDHVQENLPGQIID